MKIAGAVLVVLGLLGLLFGGIPYKKQSHVADIGDLHMSVKEEKRFSVPPVVSGIAILAGAALLFAGRSKPTA
jgi:hypothetical protein